MPVKSPLLSAVLLLPTEKFSAQCQIFLHPIHSPHLLQARCHNSFRSVSFTVLRGTSPIRLTSCFTHSIRLTHTILRIRSCVSFFYTVTSCIFFLKHLPALLSDETDPGGMHGKTMPHSGNNDNSSPDRSLPFCKQAEIQIKNRIFAEIFPLRTEADFSCFNHTSAKHRHTCGNTPHFLIICRVSKK